MAKEMQKYFHENFSGAEKNRESLAQQTFSQLWYTVGSLTLTSSKISIRASLPLTLHLILVMGGNTEDCEVTPPSFK